MAALLSNVKQWSILKVYLLTWNDLNFVLHVTFAPNTEYVVGPIAPWMLRRRKFS